MTALCPDSRSDAELRAWLGSVVAALRRERAEPLAERLVGALSQRQRVLAARGEARRAAGLDADCPCSYLAGRAGETAGVLGLQLVGVAPRDVRQVRVATIDGEEGSRGRLLEAGALRLLWLAQVHGQAGHGGASSCTAQLERMFRRAQASLRRHGMSFRHVVRTWIGLRQLRDWYGELNRVRAACYAEQGVGVDGGFPFPASTGIQATNDGEDCVMDLLAVDAPERSSLVATLERSACQAAPTRYGSSFSRGVALGRGRQGTVLVSGTASIGSDGQTRHVGSAAAQARETLRAVEALLATAGAGLGDVVSGVLFCEQPAVLAAYRQVASELGVDGLPLVPLLGDVCRPDLLLEIEAIALVGASEPRSTRLERLAGGSA